jgi:TolA-binding protein
MSHSTDTLCSSLQSRLDDLEDRIESLKTRLRSAPEQAQDALCTRAGQAQQEVESQKQALAKTRTIAQNRADEKRAEVKATTDSTTAGRKAGTLVHGVDRAEEYATAAVEVAAWCIDEAEHAVFEACAALSDAEMSPERDR